MNEAEFTKAFAGLPQRQLEVLLKFLAGEKDAKIACDLHIAQATVRKHIENICKAFELSHSQDSGCVHRPELMSLFAKYRPDLLGGGKIATGNKVLLSYYGSQNQDRMLIKELETALNDQGYEVFIASGSLRMANNGLQQIYEELNQCDYLLLLLSTLAASSEMVTEEVRWGKRLHDTRPDGKPVILPIRINCPVSLQKNKQSPRFLSVGCSVGAHSAPSVFPSSLSLSIQSSTS